MISDNGFPVEGAQIKEHFDVISGLSCCMHRFPPATSTHVALLNPILSILFCKTDKETMEV